MLKRKYSFLGKKIMVLKCLNEEKLHVSGLLCIKEKVKVPPQQECTASIACRKRKSTFIVDIFKV